MKTEDVRRVIDNLNLDKFRPRLRWRKVWVEVDDPKGEHVRRAYVSMPGGKLQWKEVGRYRKEMQMVRDRRSARGPLRNDEFLALLLLQRGPMTNAEMCDALWKWRERKGKRPPGQYTGAVRQLNGYVHWNVIYRSKSRPEGLKVPYPLRNVWCEVEWVKPDSRSVMLKLTPLGLRVCIAALKRLELIP